MTWSRLTPILKKKITADWIKEMPELGIYKPLHMMNCLGPLLVGIILEVKSGNEDYIPAFHVHNLIRSFPGVSLTLKRAYKDYIYVEWHETKYRKVAEEMKKSALIPLAGDIQLDLVLSGYKKYLDGGPVLHQPHLFEDMVLISAWCGGFAKAEESLAYAKEVVGHWPLRILEKMGGLESWTHKLQRMSSSPEELGTACKEHSRKLKVEELPHRRLLC